MNEFRVGAGWDLHPLVLGRPLIIGGVPVENDGSGLSGHSDGDVLLHAITDAILGAAALGDIGQYFPSTNPQFKGAASSTFLERAAEMVREGGYDIAAIDSTVILEQPRLGDYRDRMRQSIASILGIRMDAVSVKFKTADKLGPVGRHEAAEAHALATLRYVRNEAESL